MTWIFTSNRSFGKGICVSNWFLCWTQALFIVFPKASNMVITISYHHHFSVILLHMSCYCYHQIHKGINPSNIPQTHLPLLDFSNNFLSSIHFFQFEPGELYSGYLLGRVTAAVKQFCLYVFSKVFYLSF